MSPRRAAQARPSSQAPTLETMIAAQPTRRAVLQGALAASLASGLVRADQAGAATAEPSAPGFDFAAVAPGVDETHHVAEGYDADMLIGWGDPMVPDASSFDPGRQTPQDQERRFGYDGACAGFLPLGLGRGLLLVGHGSTSEHLMFPGVVREDESPDPLDPAKTIRELVLSDPDENRMRVELAALGASVVEVVREAGRWRVVTESRFNRRITGDTPVDVAGPAAGHPRLRVSGDRSGNRVRGVLGAGAGGLTPWRTWLLAERDVGAPFDGVLPERSEEGWNFDRMGIPQAAYPFARFDNRFNIGREPNEPNRFGWVVEVDPLDPGSTPKKRTALGRFQHGGAAAVLAKDGRAVVYLPDDEGFDHLYKFVSRDAHDASDRAGNLRLLDHGTLYVARFGADGSLRWLALTFGDAPLDPSNVFESQADVVIEARRAADLLGATRLDRPHGVAADAESGRVFLTLTGNPWRRAEQVDAANPRAPNPFGHVVEIAEDGGDAAAESARWRVSTLCGDPADPQADPAVSPVGLARPGDAALDPHGRLWVASSGQRAGTTGSADGVYAVETRGAAQGRSTLFFRAPVGARTAGLCFAPDGETLFLSVLHPGDGGEDWTGFGRRSFFEDPSTRWPDFRPDRPPRPAVVAVTRKGGGRIAG